MYDDAGDASERTIRERVAARLDQVRRGATTRVRLLGAFLAILAAALVFGLLIQRAILLQQLDEDIDGELRQEVEELEVLSTGSSPATGEPFAEDVEAIFDTFLRRNVPAQAEGIYTLVDGEPYASSPSPVQLLADADLVARWAALDAPTQGEADTEGGRIRYLAVPVLHEDEVLGTFVAAVFLEERREVVATVIRAGALAYGGAFLLTAAVAWFVAGRVLRPLTDLTEAAYAVSESNWRERIHVEGDDQIALLARTFNEMLDRLEQAFDAQRQLIDDAGHELRTPITVVRGHLELMSEAPEEREETLRLVMDELDRMGRMVEDLLLLARADHANFLHPQPVDVDDLMEAIALKAGMLGDRGWEVEEHATVVAIADEQRLTQAMMNLCRNALEHTPEGTSVTLGSRVRGGWVYLWVEDDGPGIAPADQQRIFERFARASDTARSADGAGLGLAIARVIAEAHGGGIVLDSRLGEGARFTLLIPVEPADPLDAHDGFAEDPLDEGEAMPA